jgi:hypothetical protein
LAQFTVQLATACVAALSAEPETIKELEAALERFDKEPLCFQSLFSERCEIDEEPYDAGILVIDLAGRIVACESTYSHPGPKGHVRYHTGDFATDFSIGYRLPDDWLFLSCISNTKGLVRSDAENDYQFRQSIRENFV